MREPVCVAYVFYFRECGPSREVEDLVRSSRCVRIDHTLDEPQCFPSARTLRPPTNRRFIGHVRSVLESEAPGAVRRRGAITGDDRRRHSFVSAVSARPAHTVSFLRKLPSRTTQFLDHSARSPRGSSPLKAPRPNSPPYARHQNSGYLGPDCGLVLAIDTADLMLDRTRATVTPPR